MKGINSIKFASFALFFVMSLAASFPVFAVDYYWVTGYSTSGIVTGSYSSASPTIGCQALTSAKGWTFQSAQYQSDTLFRCNYRVSSNVTGYTNFERKGTACPAGQTYESATGNCRYPSDQTGNICPGEDEKGFNNIINTAGECVSILRADKPAVCKSLGNSTRSIHSFVSYGLGDGPDSSTVKSPNGCQIANVTTANCETPARSSNDRISLLPAGAKCDVTFTYTGAVDPSSDKAFQPADPATNTDGQCSESMDCTPQKQPDVNEKKDCVYVEDAEGRKVCSSSAYSGSPGTQKCATGESGRVVCVGKQPSSNGIKIDTSIKTTSNSDGSSTSVKTDVSTKSNCPSGSSSCKVTTTTTTTTTTKNAAGEVTGSNSETTCKGDSCSGNSSGGGAGNGGKGDDTTNCDPATDPKACEGGSTDGGGKKCDAPIQCDGDAVMCAILQQQHKDTCELMADPTDEEKSKFEQDKAADAAKVDDLQKDLDQKASGLFADFKVKASGGQYAGQCLADKEVDIMGTSFTFPFSKACPYLYLLRYAIIAMAYLAAARIVSRGI